MPDQSIDAFIPRTEDYPPLAAPTLVLRLTTAETWKLLYLLSFMPAPDKADLQTFRTQLHRAAAAALLEAKQ